VLMAAVGRARLLVPIVAVPSHGRRSDQLTAERPADMAVVTLTGSDGSPRVPGNLAAWPPSRLGTPRRVRRR